ncbi:MAG UNVERIFIED_CONTAM: hypothetical protein LVT10_25565 [Anaerolineae bacterium]
MRYNQAYYPDDEWKPLLMPVTIAPNDPAIIEYLAWIKRTRQQTNAHHEGNMRHGFAVLLDKIAKRANLILEQEYSTRTAKNNRVRYDGRVRDDSNLTHGYWEAKDTQDDLEAEIRKKRDAGYDFKNIIFEDSRTAVLYQQVETHHNMILLVVPISRNPIRSHAC